jgi:uncharacterized phosphatase
MSNKFIFVRHGQSEANAAKLIADESHPLTETGKDQARKTGVELKNKGIQKIVCSPMIRAHQTAEMIAKELGYPLENIQIINELHERRFGKFENNTREHEPSWYYNHPGGHDGIESQEAVIARSQIALGKIKELAKDNSLLVVGHSCAGFYLLQVAKGKKTYTEFDEPMHMSNADFIEVEV